MMRMILIWFLRIIPMIIDAILIWVDNVVRFGEKRRFVYRKLFLNVIIATLLKTKSAAVSLFEESLRPNLTPVILGELHFETPSVCFGIGNGGRFSDYFEPGITGFEWIC